MLKKCVSSYDASLNSFRTRGNIKMYFWLIDVGFLILVLFVMRLDGFGSELLFSN